MKNTLLRILFFVIILSPISWQSYAQNSYIYIELIKAIPCRVMQNGTEVVQLDKNFVVLQVAGQREEIIDIEFGADLYPKQNFVIDVAPNASYAYKLAKSGEQSFYLLDLVNNGKIIESNSAVNIGLATDLNVINFGKDQKPNLNKGSRIKTRGKWLRKAFVKSNPKKKKSTKTAPVTQNRNKAQTSNQNVEKQKYGVIETISASQNEKVPEVAKASKETSENSGKPVQKSNLKQIRANCNLIAAEEEVRNFIEKIGVKNDDEIKLIICRNKHFTGCLSVAQVQQIGENFNTQYGRFNFVKMMLPITANPQDILQCESLFRTEGYKNKFRQLVEPYTK